MVRGSVGQEPQVPQACADGTAVDESYTAALKAARILAEAVQDLRRRASEGGGVDDEELASAESRVNELTEAMEAITGMTSQVQSSTPYPYPEGWDQSSGGDCQLVPLPRDSEEFKAVEAVLCNDVHAEGSDMRLVPLTSRVPGNDMGRTVVDSVTRVQNKWLWEAYSHRKRFMEQREGGGYPNERWLWHGSKSTPPEVLCSGYDGIDFRRTGAGNLYGRGVYFAEQPRYCDFGYAYHEDNRNPAGFKKLILARVLCGKEKEMGLGIDKSLTHPPEGYDSIRGGPRIPCWGGKEHSSPLRAVYDNSCVYPSYIVRYRYSRTPPKAKVPEGVSQSARKLQSPELNVKQAPPPHHQTTTPQQLPCSHDHSEQCDTSATTSDETSTHVQTQCCPEGDLWQWLQATPRSVREVASMTCRLLQELLSFHNEGVIHGDIKPGNILISYDQQPRIRSRGGEPASRGKHPQGYVAPEVLAGSPTSWASDMFAMGKVLQRMLEAVADVDAGDDDSLALQQEMQRLAEACCAEQAADRPTVQVQLSPLHRHLPAHQAARSRVVARRVTSLEVHFCWEVRHDDGSWQRLADGHTGAVVVKYPQPRALQVQQRREADEREDERKGDDGEATGHSRPPFTPLEDGSGMTYQRDAVEGRARRLAEVFPYPEGWHQFGGDCELVLVPRDSDEFKAVAAVLCSDIHAVESDMRLADPATREQLGKDMSGIVVGSVTRVQNKWLWRKYSLQKMFMEQREGGGDANELWLWHGSSTTPPEVLCRSHDGIDFRRSRGGHYGFGAYFAEQPRYSDFCYAYEGEELRNPTGFKQLILVRVLCGKAQEMGAETDGSITLPAEGYDSIRGGLHYPADPVTHRGAEHCLSHIRAVYDRTCVYPAYIVGYKQPS